MKVFATKRNRTTIFNLPDMSESKALKFAKDLSFVLPLKHPKRQKIEKEINKIQKEILTLNSRLIK